MSDDELAWETLDQETAFSCPGFTVEHQTVRLPDGTETDFDYLSERPAVVILPFTTDGSVVVIEEWRQAVGRINYGLPAGGVEAEDDDLTDAARRELREETGYESTKMEPLTTVEPANGIADSVHHYFVAHGCTPTASQDLDTNEAIRPSITTLETLRKAIRAGEIRDARTVLGVCYHGMSKSDEA
ncbi:NUDIX hydrolase [Halocatena halophila]|uniref:NUDIX hydrolase n=1 Tax=Halocatena halophila TaxID=2814576 RepID=UPI002ED4C2D2